MAAVPAVLELEHTHTHTHHRHANTCTNTRTHANVCMTHASAFVHNAHPCERVWLGCGYLQQRSGSSYGATQLCYMPRCCFVLLVPTPEE